MTHTKEDFEQAIEILFKNLDTKNWEDSYQSATHEHNEPNTLFKITVSDKISSLYDVITEYVESLEKRLKEE